MQPVLAKLQARGHEVLTQSSHRWFGATMAIINTCREGNDGEAAEAVGCLQATTDWRAEEDARKAPKPDGY